MLCIGHETKMIWLLFCAPLLVSAISFKKCPVPTDIQSEYVGKHFDLNLFQGLFYELAYKDITQPHICECITTDKKLILEENRVSDDFSIRCANKAYHSDLSFNITQTPGFFYSRWRGVPLIDRVLFSDTVVDVEVVTDANGQAIDYKWVVEFQCVEKFGVQWFYGINFYSKSKAEGILDEMIARARAHGLGWWLDQGRPLHLVNHENCVYE